MLPAVLYLPIGWSVREWLERRKIDPDSVAKAAMESMAQHVQAMLESSCAGVPTFDYGNNTRQMAFDQCVKDAFDFPEPGI